MPTMYVNPNWTEDNGQPQWLPYVPQNPGYVDPNQVNMVHPALGAQPGMTPISGGPVNSGVPSNAGIPCNGGFPSNIHVPNNAGVPINAAGPSNSRVPPSTARARSTGLTPNTGVPMNTGMPSNNGAIQGRISNPNMSSVPVNTRVHAHGQRQHIQGQPTVRQPTAPSQMRAQTGNANGRSSTGRPASRPVNYAAQLEADMAEVKSLQNSNEKTGHGLIKSFEHQKRLEKAERHMRRRGGPDLSGDMPPDDAGRGVLADRLCDAITNLENIESRETRVNQSKRGDNKTMDSAGVKCVKEKKGYEIANLAWKFMVSVCPQPIMPFVSTVS